MKYLVSLFILASAVLIINSCKKTFLEERPLGQLDESALANKKGVERLLIGAYSLLDGYGSSKNLEGWGSAASNWIYGSLCGSEAYTGSEALDQPELRSVETFFSVTPTNTFLAEKWGVVYDGVQRANDVLRIMTKATDISSDDQKRISAEARFLRAHYHFEAKKMWNKVPFIDESISYANGNYRASNEKDIWPDIENDLRYATDNLKNDPYQGAAGRATKYTAMALLAKSYMFQKKYVEAKPLLLAVINSGKFSLGSYHENFNPEKIVRKEAIFSVQMSVNDGANGENGNYGDALNFPFGGGPGGCCGFFCPSQWLVNHFKTNSNGLPDIDGFNNYDVIHDLGLAGSDPFTPYPGFLDPRLDWTVGRRGIPYLDWGVHPGAAPPSGGGWIRDSLWAGPYSPKKNVFYKSQEGRLTDIAFWGGFASLATTNNVNLIRFADVLLWAAEVEIETGGGDMNLAREYVNKIRRRAAIPEGWVYSYIDPNNPSLGFTNIPAANYKIGEYLDPWTDRTFARKAVQYERVLELAMEGHRFFDLVRWGIAEAEINAYLNVEKTKRKFPLMGADFKNNRNEYFPIPQVQIDLSVGPDGISKMIQNPGY